MPETSTTAWGDESVRTISGVQIYLLAACILHASPNQEVQSLLKLMPSNAKKLHWRDMGTRAQRKALDIIAGIQHSTCIVAAVPIERKKQERARRKCLEALLIYLEQRHVDILVLESRDEPLDKLDIDFLFYLRRNGTIEAIDIMHAKGSEDPNLCIPDQILGAYGECYCAPGKTPPWAKTWDEIKSSVKVKSICV